MPQFPLHWKGTKKIRAAHAKEKQQTPETCNHPNRLNLLIWTPELGPRSNFTKNSDENCSHRPRAIPRRCELHLSVALAAANAYNRSSAWDAACERVASSRTSCKSDLNSHFSSAVMSAG